LPHGDGESNLSSDKADYWGGRGSLTFDFSDFMGVSGPATPAIV
jgi:hypothetical protein